MILDFFTTAMNRPEVLRQTYESFTKNLLGVEFNECRLWLNVDPMPAGDRSAVASVAEEFFGEVIFNFPVECSFPRAIQWCMSHLTPDFAFGLEDDWLLMRVMDIAELFKFLVDDPKLSVVNLRYYPSQRDEVCLAPGLWRTEHARRIAAGLRMDANPEYQLRNPSPSNPHGGLHKRTDTHGKQFPGYKCLEEIGRPWMERNGLMKENKTHFTRWVQKVA